MRVTGLRLGESRSWDEASWRPPGATLREESSETETRVEPPDGPARPSLGVCSKERKQYAVATHACPVHSSSHKSQSTEPARCPSTGERWRDVVFRHEEFYSAIKKESMSFVGQWTEPESIGQVKGANSEDQGHTFSLMWKLEKESGREWWGNLMKIEGRSVESRKGTRAAGREGKGDSSNQIPPWQHVSV